MWISRNRRNVLQDYRSTVRWTEMISLYICKPVLTLPPLPRLGLSSMIASNTSKLFVFSMYCARCSNNLFSCSSFNFSLAAWKETLDLFHCFSINGIQITNRNRWSFKRRCRSNPQTLASQNHEHTPRHTPTSYSTITSLHIEICIRNVWWPWPLTYDLDLRTWPRYPYTWPPCQNSSLHVCLLGHESGNRQTNNVKTITPDMSQTSVKFLASRVQGQNFRVNRLILRDFGLPLYMRLKNTSVSMNSWHCKDGK